MSQVLPSEPQAVQAATLETALLSWWQSAVIAGLLLWLYYPTVSHLIRQWWTDPNFSHGFFVPLFSAFVIWQERSRLIHLSLRPSWWGMLLLGLGLSLLIVGQLGAELFLSRLSLLIVLAGLIVLFLGWGLLRALLFPWAFLLLMIPIPTIVFNLDHLPATVAGVEGCQHDLALDGRTCVAGRQRHPPTRHGPGGSGGL